MADAVCEAEAFENHGGKVRKLFELGERSRGGAVGRDGLKLGDQLLMNRRVGEDVVRDDSQRMCTCEQFVGEDGSR